MMVADMPQQVVLRTAMLGPFFLSYVALVAAAVAAVLKRYMPPRAAWLGLAGLLVWLAYAGALGYSGILQDPALRPPGIARMVGPILVSLLALMGIGKFGRLVAAHVPLAVLVGLQSFRVGVEVCLHLLWQAGLLPHAMTLQGGNIEIIVALTAPLAAWAATRGQRARQVVWAWNLVGLLSLANVVVRSVLTAPGPLNLIHTEVPNLALAQFPFSFIPGLMAPLALVLHVLVFRAMRIETKWQGV